MSLLKENIRINQFYHFYHFYQFDQFDHFYQFYQFYQLDILTVFYLFLDFKGPHMVPSIYSDPGFSGPCFKRHGN